MAGDDVAVAIIGGGAAGIGAARALRDAGVDCVILEARPRLGGRAWSVTDGAGHALDLGCGWLHSADRNPLSAIAQSQGRMVDKTIPPWQRPAASIGFPPDEQRAFREAMGEFYRRLAAIATEAHDKPAAAFLDPGNRWNGLINAASTYISGATLEHISARDLDRYDDTGVNWRVVEGYGRLIAAAGAGLPVMLDCPVQRIDHGGKRLLIETARGEITADRAIVTLPTNVLAEGRVTFTPALASKREAAARLPLGLADKLFLSLDRAEEFDADTRIFGHTDRAATAAYHMRPFGRPQIEVYFGGELAAALETEGDAAFFEFARDELTGLLGSAFAARIAPLHLHCWGRDPFARGSYSYASPGGADCRATLAAPVDGRLLFAGEACSAADFSTAHGAWQSGVDAANYIISQADGASRRP